MVLKPSQTFFPTALRGSLPRPRYDQLLGLGWKVMLPIALVNLAATGGIVLAVGR